MNLFNIFPNKLNRIILKVFRYIRLLERMRDRIPLYNQEQLNNCKRIERLAIKIIS